MNLKEKLTLIKDNGYQAPAEPFPLVQEMINNIGSLDAELRDGLIYETLSHWIPDNVLTAHELEELLPVILDEEHLLYNLGESNTDSVFTRSFSMLLIPLLFTRHNASPFLSKKDIQQIKQCVFYSLREERDYRGYDEQKSWAHATAHAADALNELAQCPELDQNDLLTILNLVYDKMILAERIYSDGEDERMVRPVISVLNRKIIGQSYVEQWIQRFADVEKSPEFIPAFRQKNNIKNFLKSFYFRVKYYEVNIGLCPVIEETLYQVEKVYYA